MRQAHTYRAARKATARLHDADLPHVTIDANLQVAS